MYICGHLIALVVLQNLTDSENVRGLCTEIVSSHDAYQAIRIKAEALSDVEEEEDRVPTTFPLIKAEPEVSCVSVSTLGGFHKYRYSLFMNFCYSEQLTFKRSFCRSRDLHTQFRAGREKLTSPPACTSSNYTESALLLMLTFYQEISVLFVPFIAP
jgi:hypothetical protein